MFCHGILGCPPLLVSRKYRNQTLRCCEQVASGIRKRLRHEVFLQPRLKLHVARCIWSPAVSSSSRDIVKSTAFLPSALSYNHDRESTLKNCILLRQLNRGLSSSSGGRGRSNRGGKFQLDALPFTVSPDDAYNQFEKWAIEEQGLGPLLSAGGRIGSASISAAYAPFWSFDLNVRFVAQGKYGWRPEPFRSAYPNAPRGVIYIPGLSAYAGFSYRRSLMDPVHNTSPVFMQQNVVPFGSWMLEPLKFKGGSSKSEQTLEIFPDPWNATRERAFSIICDELQDMANDQYHQQYNIENVEVQVETERLNTRRIYMPTYIVDYTILGVSYRAFLSGCDPSIQVSGVSHKSMFSAGSKGEEVFQGASSFLTHRVAPMAASALQFFGLRPFIALGQLFWGLVSRIAMRIHFVAVIGGGALMAWRKLVRPYMDDRAASAEWERQREHEAQMNEPHSSFFKQHFRDDGSAKLYFTSNRKRILRQLSGEEGRQHDGADSHEWYKQWEEWARQQWEQAQRQAYQEQQEWSKQYQQQQQQQGRQRSSYGQYQQQQKQTQYKKKTEQETFKWDFDPNDPYSVLGVPRNASKEEVSKAFRREMLKHHPDTQAGASEKEKRKATERSKLISDAYRKIKSGFKK